LTSCFAEGFGERFFAGLETPLIMGCLRRVGDRQNVQFGGMMLPMETSPISTPRIIDSDRLDDGVLVLFSDGRSVLYSADLLYSMIELAEEIAVRGEE
jgi:hypothetical protein